jgi:3-dehydroquinate synthase
VPTTLLAQVDSSVGGKTAVNHQLGKNMIGAFHQPQAVIADTDTLTTLPDREFRSGLAEVIKYGLMADATFFTWLQDNMNGLLERHSDLLVEAIIRSCRAKADIVSADEREGGQRALLNLGHTFGHAIETAQNYRTWLHGEAVAAGMVMAAQFSQALGWLKPSEVESIATLIARAGLPTAPPAGVTVEQFLSLMAVDKKSQNGVLRLVLLRGIGDGRVTADYDPDLLRATLAQLVS